MSITHKLNKSERHVAHLSRFPHDMSQLFGFTMSTGMILPMYKDFLNVGETVYLKHSMIARTQPIITAAMADVHFYVDWFFVPATMLFTPFGQYRWQTNDFISDHFADGGSNVADGYFPLFDIDFQLGFKSSSTESDSTTYNYGGLNSSFGTHVQNSYRLADHLAYNPAAALYVRPTGTKRYNPNVFPIFALAYQSIYQKYYRDETWERLNLRSYNVDSAYQNPTTLGHNSVNERNLFQLRFANWKKDYFTSVRPQPYLSSLNLLGNSTIIESDEQYNPLQVFQRVQQYLDYPTNQYERYNAVDVNQNIVEQTVGSSDNPNRLASVFTQIGGSRKNFGVYNDDGDEIGFVGLDDDERRYKPVSALGTAQLRNMFAVEKLMRIVGLSKKDYDHQALAHFGFKVPHDVKHDLTHIFGNHGILHIGEIISTADTASGSDGAALGQVGGKGYLYIASDKKAHKFTAPVDGVIMAVAYCVPDVMYYDTFEKQNAITDMQSLFNPEYDKLGSQPLFNYESVNYDSGLDPSKILGWQYRFEQYKRKFNRLTVAFSQARNGVNVFGSWFIGRSPFNYFAYNGSMLAYQQFKCPPTALDNIMVVPYNINYSESWIENPHLIYQTDPFICQFSADVKKLSTMSPYGEPDLNGI